MLALVNSMEYAEEAGLLLGPAHPPAMRQTGQ